ncbi:MAG: periplasmic heavy metal sensor [Yoonia sp.]|uniref:periplasmic heavy metal sensor n=2 Tax=Yoonia sp. TaxID=2212373 RepID=UPI0032981674
MGNMPKQAKPGRVWRIVLVTSLAINLLILGLVGGAYLRSGGTPPGAFDVRLGPLTAALPPKDRREIGDQLRRGPGKPGLSRLERRQAFEDLILVLESQPFDPEALSRIFQIQQERQFELQGRALAAFVVRVTNMTLEERAAFAGRLRENSERRGNRDDQRPPRPNSGG